MSLKNTIIRMSIPMLTYSILRTTYYNTQLVDYNNPKRHILMGDKLVNYLFSITLSPLFFCFIIDDLNYIDAKRSGYEYDGKMIPFIHGKIVLEKK